jgi:hypothetical protein
MEFNQAMKYTKLELPGALLVDGFSVYLIEVEYAGTNYYYVGMTGDNHYRSARAGFYRLVGHLEYQNRRSTQNQLLKALAEIMKTHSRRELNQKIDKALITFHHFPIDGFVPDPNLKLASEDNGYRKLRQEVLDLENALIHRLRPKLSSRLLNDTKGKDYKNGNIPHSEVLDAVMGLVK